MLALSEKPIKPTTSTVPEEKPPKYPANPPNPLMEFEFEFKLKLFDISFLIQIMSSQHQVK